MIRVLFWRWFTFFSMLFKTPIFLGAIIHTNTMGVNVKLTDRFTKIIFLTFFKLKEVEITSGMLGWCVGELKEMGMTLNAINADVREQYENWPTEEELDASGEIDAQHFRLSKKRKDSTDKDIN